MKDITKCRILLSTDYDADGILSAVVGMKSFISLGIKFEHIILNNRYPRGISKQTIDKVLLLTDTDEEFVFMTADHGSSSMDEFIYLRKRRKNVYIIMTDHHIIPSEIALEETCDEIYNPYYSKCEYNKNLSGAGVLHKYLSNFTSKETSTKLLAYVAIANLIDQMSMLDKGNIEIYHTGFEQYKELDFIKRMLKISKKKVPHDRWVLMNLGPLLNSSHRLGQPEVSVRALMGDMGACTELDLLNRKRKDLTNDLVKEISSQIKANRNSLDNMMILVLPSNSLASLTGLVAGRVGNDLNVPTFVFKRTEGTLKGSARAIQELPLLDIYADIKSKCNSIVAYGGHDMANGLEINYTKESIDNFIKYFDKYLETNNIKYTDTVEAIEIQSSEITTKVKEIELGRPYGNKKPYPVFKIMNLEIIKVSGFKKITFVKLTDGTNIIDGIYFGKKYIDMTKRINITGTIESDNKISIVINDIEQPDNSL